MIGDLIAELDRQYARYEAVLAQHGHQHRLTRTAELQFVSAYRAWKAEREAREAWAKVVVLTPDKARAEEFLTAMRQWEHAYDQRELVRQEDARAVSDAWTG